MHINITKTTTSMMCCRMLNSRAREVAKAEDRISDRLAKERC